VQIGVKSAIDRAKQLISDCRHAAMATVNADGSPHNTPYFFIMDDARQKLFWSSHPQSQHSQNITRTGELFVVLFDAVKSGGLYIAAKNGHKTAGSELRIALAAHNKRRAAWGKPSLDAALYADGPQHMYAADITDLWVNCTQRDAAGNFVRESRQSITPQDLLVQ